MEWLKASCKWIKNTSEDKVLTSYEDHNNEVRSVTSLSTYPGIRSEISKTLNPNLQLSKISIIDKNSHVSQFFTTICTNNALFQLSIDHEKCLQFRSTGLYNNIMAKFHTIVSKKKDVFTQIDIDIKNSINNLSLKLIDSEIKDSGYIYVCNVMQQLGKFSIGSEIIGANSELGMSLCGRYEDPRFIATFAVQQFSVLNLTYYRKIGKLFNLGLDLHTGPRYSTKASIGLKLTGRKSEVKASVNNDLSFALVYTEKLTEALGFEININADKKDIAYGLGFNLEF